MFRTLRALPMADPTLHYSAQNARPPPRSSLAYRPALRAWRGLWDRQVVRAILAPAADPPRCYPLRIGSGPRLRALADNSEKISGRFERTLTRLACVPRRNRPEPARSIVGHCWESAA